MADDCQCPPSRDRRWGVIILDISKPFQWKPGCCKTQFGVKTNYRAWWGWLAITFCNMSDYAYLRYIASGKTEWVTANPEQQQGKDQARAAIGEGGGE